MVAEPIIPFNPQRVQNALNFEESNNKSKSRRE